MRAARITRLPYGLDVVRELPAPVPRVFRALSEPDELLLWWGPPDYPMVRCTVDFRPGGLWHYLLRGERTGEEFWARAVYGEITPPTSLSYLETSSDASGSVTDERPPASVVVGLAAAEEDEGTTRITIRIRHRSTVDRDRAIGYGVESGLSRALDILDGLLASPSSDKEHP